MKSLLVFIFAGCVWAQAPTGSLPCTGTTCPPSYTYSSKFAASSTTDIAGICGNATTVTYLYELRVTGTQTTAGNVNVEVVKRSAADTSGTAATITAVPDDSGSAGANSVAKSYTGTGPSVGAAVGDLDNAQIGFMAAATASPNDIYVGNFRPKPIVLRTTAECVYVNLGGAVTGGTVTVTLKTLEKTN